MGRGRSPGLPAGGGVRRVFHDEAWDQRPQSQFPRQRHRGYGTPGDQRERQHLKVHEKGVTGSVAFNVNPVFGVVADFRYNQNNIVDFTVSDGLDSVNGNVKVRNLSLMAGPRFSYRGNERVTPFAHALIGLDHIRLSGEAEGEGELMRNTNNGLGFALGGGLDVNLSESVAIRLIQADYYLTRHEGDSMNNMNLAFGVVFRIGQ
ncbi:MAG: outer membrane beta-barrel protein [Acidobacteria bacterium]|nr:outer membrane beta-barrel protein [Acidobacteriota bacterium]